MRWTEEQIIAMDMYIWLDYSIERIWINYMEQFQGNYDITVKEELSVLKMMEVVYDMETMIIDLIDKHQITFQMIDLYKEEFNVPSWPTRFC